MSIEFWEVCIRPEANNGRMYGPPRTASRRDCEGDRER